ELPFLRIQVLVTALSESLLHTLININSEVGGT
ncbi:unnamed protein product, partial [marine sediment metagenome]